jgi:aspartyl protease family protein
MDAYSPATYISALVMALFALWILSSVWRHGWLRNFQNAAIWLLIFIGIIAGFGMWQDIQRDVAPRQAVFADQGRVEAPRGRDGHYYLTLDVNGSPVDFVVDTGASEIVLTKADAEAVGLAPADLNYFGRALTANGEVRTAPVRLDSIGIGEIKDTDVPAYVNEGDMFQSLLGMAYLQRWERIEIADGKLILTR